MTRIKEILKRVLPDFVINTVTGFFYGWHGNYKSWEEASKKCSGYDSQLIVDKVRESTLKVKTGKAAYERDSFIFDEIQYSYPVLSSLMWIAAQNKGNISVLDFGGSLGSTYYQNRYFLNGLDEVNWCIVEQPNFVKIGINEFSDHRLKFYYSIYESLKENNIDVFLLSSVLPYIEKPYELLEEIKCLRVKYILVDRTQFISRNDRITVQKVHPAIYKASYLCWFLNKQKFTDFMKKDYDLILEFDTLGKANIKSEFKGFLFKLKEKPSSL
jgi:putative methyltransferase (TIGR04325 family)